MTDTALDMLAEDGLARVTAELVATRAGSGKAAVYRRWPTIPALIAQAVGTCDLVPDTPDTGSLRRDLIALLQPWTHPLSRCERAAASLLGHAGRNTHFGHVLESEVVEPLAAVITQIAGSHAHRGPAIPPAQVRLLGLVAQSLWWQRYTAPNRLTHDEVAALVDQVLLPVALAP